MRLRESPRTPLQHWLRSPPVPAGLARRARRLLLLEEPNPTLKQAAPTAGLAPRPAPQWVPRFLAQGLEGLHDRPRPGRPPAFSPRGRAALDTRTGKGYGRTAERKRQAELIAPWEMLGRGIDAQVTVIQVVPDDLRMHQGKQVQAWLAKHPRFVFHQPPVHGSGMDQVEQWFSTLQRQRLCIADFAGKAALAGRLQAFIREWKEVAHPFARSTKSVAKIMAKWEPALPEGPAEPAGWVQAA